MWEGWGAAPPYAVPSLPHLQSRADNTDICIGENHRSLQSTKFETKPFPFAIAFVSLTMTFHVFFKTFLARIFQLAKAAAELTHFHWRVFRRFLCYYLGARQFHISLIISTSFVCMVNDWVIADGIFLLAPNELVIVSCDSIKLRIAITFWVDGPMPHQAYVSYWMCSSGLLVARIITSSCSLKSDDGHFTSCIVVPSMFVAVSS